MLTPLARGSGGLLVHWSRADTYAFNKAFVKAKAVSPPRAEGSRELSDNAGRYRPVQSSQHPSQVCRQPAVTGAGQSEFATHFGDESAPNDAGEHDLGQQPAQMGGPESANHGSTRNKSKSFQASRRAGAPCVSATRKSPAGHAAVGRSRPAFIGHRNYPFVVARRYRVQARPKDGGDEQGFDAEQQQGRTRRGARRSAIFRGACAPGSRPHRVSEDGSDEQMFGAKQQVPHGGSGD